MGAKLTMSLHELLRSLWALLVAKASACQHRRCRFDPWVEKITLEEEMGPHSSILAWEIPQTEEPGRLHPMGSQRVGQD